MLNHDSNIFQFKWIILSWKNIYWKLKVWVVWLFQVLTLALEVTSDQKVLAVRKPTHDLQSDFYWDFLSNWYSFWDIWLQTFKVLTLSFDL